jgi:hypothetical protein
MGFCSCAARGGFHQYGVATWPPLIMFTAIIPLVAVVSLLLLELIRSLAKQYELEVMIACVPWD